MRRVADLGAAEDELDLRAWEEVGELVPVRGLTHQPLLRLGRGAHIKQRERPGGWRLHPQPLERVNERQRIREPIEHGRLDADGTRRVGRQAHLQVVAPIRECPRHLAPWPRRKHWKSVLLAPTQRAHTLAVRGVMLESHRTGRRGGGRRGGRQV